MRAMAIPLLLFVAAPAARAQMAQDSAAQADSLRAYGQMIVQTADSIFLVGAGTDSARAANGERYETLRHTTPPGGVAGEHQKLLLLARDRVFPRHGSKLPGPGEVGGGGTGSHCYMEVAANGPVTNDGRPIATGSTMECQQRPVPGSGNAPRVTAGVVPPARTNRLDYRSIREAIARRLAESGVELPSPSAGLDP